jgi:hypothetical protein
MKIVKPIGNLLRYGSMNLMSPVDPDIMRPIFEARIAPISFCSPGDVLSFHKTGRKDLEFQYLFEQRPFDLIEGRIYAQQPRENFGEVDVISFMEISHITLDQQGEVLSAIEGIVKDAYIERVIRSPLCDIDGEDTKSLFEIRGHRRPDYLR